MARTDAGGPAPPVVPPGPSAVDLHTHTLRSDGVLSPRELVAAAAAVGVRSLAITDHDTLAAVPRAGRGAGAIPPALELWPGVEINTVTDGTRLFWPRASCTSSGFGVDPDDDAFEAALAAPARARRRERSSGWSGGCASWACRSTTSPSALDDNERWAGPRSAAGPRRGGLAASVDDAFERIIGWGGPAYVPRHGDRAAGGDPRHPRARAVSPVLAHFAEAADRQPARSASCSESAWAGSRSYYRRSSRETVVARGGRRRRRWASFAPAAATTMATR